MWVKKSDSRYGIQRFQIKKGPKVDFDLFGVLSIKANFYM